MAEARHEEEEELRELRQRNRHPDRSSERNKPEHFHASPGPLSSIRAAIKRTRTNSPSDHTRDRSRPEITILSAEPLAAGAWFPRPSGGFASGPPQQIWAGSIQTTPQPPPSYDQVIKEKTQEHVATPTAAPRRSTTIATQTDPVEDPAPGTEDPAPGPGRTAASQPIEGRSTVKKPQKPPRPSLPKSLSSTSTSRPTHLDQTPTSTSRPAHLDQTPTSTSRPTHLDQTPTSTSRPTHLDQTPTSTSRPTHLDQTPTSTSRPTHLDQTPSTSVNQSETQSSVAQPSPPDSSCRTPQTPSVHVYSDAPATPSDSVSTTAEHIPTQRPTPQPRLKSHKQPIPEEVKVQTLIRLSDNGETSLVTPEEGYLNKYLQELLDVFPGDDQCDQGFDVGNQSDGSQHSEDEDMSAIHSQRQIQARIQAFEKQASVVKDDKVQGCPTPRPRNAQLRAAPPVAAKPALVRRPPIGDTRSTGNNHRDAGCSSVLTPPYPTPLTKPHLPRKPSLDPAPREEPESRPTKTAILPPSQSSLAARAKAFLPPEEIAAPPAPPEKPRHELFNLNNHNSTSVVENQYSDSPSNQVQVQPVRSEASFSRQSITRRPTTIRVPSKGSLRRSDECSEAPPPLPAQKPVGSLPPPAAHTHRFNTPHSQDSLNAEQELSLPPRPAGGKLLPPRPPPAKAGPGRPPPPRFNGSGRPPPSSGAPSVQQAQKPRKKGPTLPPRPRPGHRLYNKYTLELPHAIAQFDYRGSSTEELSFQKEEVLLLLEQVDQQTFQCQAGDATGRVHQAHMKIITPLCSSTPPQHTQQVSPAGSGLQAQALHDFTPEGPGELSLRTGDVVSEVEQLDSEWSRGTCRGSSGFFPTNYVTALWNASTPTPGATPGASPGPTPRAEARPPAGPVRGPRCAARFDFEGQDSSELSFCEGDVIRLLDYVGQEWARGQAGGHTGIFPLNFVEVIEDLPPPPAPKQHSAPTRIALPGMVALPKTQQAASPNQPCPGGEWAVALYDFAGESEEDLSFQQGERILVTLHLDADWCSGQTRGREGVFPRAFIQTSPGHAPPGHAPAKDTQQTDARGGRAKALFDFPSDCEEELSLQVGDVITSLESVDEEWFLGDLRGKRALVPKNYVQVLAES